MKNNIAAIFDMDGVIVDNYDFHNRAWTIFCSRHGIDLGGSFRSKVFGGTNRDHLGTFFRRALTDAEIARYEAEKESLYRDLYRDHITPVRGLVSFLDLLAAASIPLALATSSPPVNVEFVLSATGIAGHFKHRIDASGVVRGKPDPEIYLKSANALGVDPGRCVVFEDSVNGITAAKRAGMKVIALTTTHPVSELPEVDLVIPDFTGMDPGRLRILF